MRKHCGNCAVYDRKNMKHSKLCGKCVTKHFPNGKESDPSMWKPLPQTNADRIRAMSDEELADMFAQFEFSIAKEMCAIFGVDITIIEHDFGASAKEELEWLKQPAKGE